MDENGEKFIDRSSANIRNTAANFFNSSMFRRSEPFIRVHSFLLLCALSVVCRHAQSIKMTSMSYVIFIRCRIYRQPLHTNVCVYKHQRERQASSLLFYIQPVDRNNRINNGHLRRACLSMYSFVASPHLFFRRYQSKLPLFCCVCHPAQKDSLVGPLRSFFSKPHTHRNRVHPIQNKNKNK